MAGCACAKELAGFQTALPNHTGSPEQPRLRWLFCLGYICCQMKCHHQQYTVLVASSWRRPGCWPLTEQKPKCQEDWAGRIRVLKTMSQIGRIKQCSTQCSDYNSQ
jgi:hypothetical protein